MSDRYFHRITKLTSNRLWINNPTPEEAHKAIEEGAINCTTNPTYVSKQLASQTENDYTIRVIDESIDSTNNVQDAASEAQRKMVKRLLDIFYPLYEKHPLKHGYVSIQCDPHREEDADFIIKEALSDMKLGKNAIAKIPVTTSGLKAIEYLIGKDVPIIATEVMSISQAIEACELYKRVSSSTGKTPPFFVTHITGIFDEYLQNAAKNANVDIPWDYLWQAGCIVARKQYKLLKDRAYPVTMLGGGARDLHHFTEMIGSDVHITINWKGSADKLLELDPPVVYRMGTPSPEHVVKELLEKLPDFHKAYDEGALNTEEYKDFGPVVLFRNSFIKGWDQVIETINDRVINK